MKKPIPDIREIATQFALGGTLIAADRYGRGHINYRFIEDACTYDEVANTTQAREAAAMFGRFQSLLGDLPGPRLHETIPNFHNTPAKFRQFHEVLERDAHDRARHCAAEIDCVLAYEEAAGALQALQDAGEIPERIAHNDTKLNNVMFDEHSDKAICVIDLDTVMPGSVLYDFGDLVRTAATPTAEDETDLSTVRMRMDYYEALVASIDGQFDKMLKVVDSVAYRSES